MLVSELKKEVEKYDKKELIKIITELYKRVPKKKKEDYDIDEFIRTLKNNDVKKTKPLTFEELQKEIIYFLMCVDNDLYATPNKIISKKERSSWRFKVKKYYKELTSIMPDSKHGVVATSLLIEIFKRLSIGSNILLFVNWETFKALGVNQSDYYDMLMKRILFDGYSNENLQKCIDLLDVPKDPYELSYNMFWTFIDNLNTPYIKEQALKLLEDKVQILNQKLKEVKDYQKEFAIKSNINNYVECILEIYLLLHDSIKGINYFHKNYIESDKEVKEYILLDKIDELMNALNLKNVWIEEYESKMNQIDFRQSIKEKYSKLKKSSQR